MRGSDERSGALFSYVDLEERVPTKHPLRRIRQLVNDVLESLDGEFATLYAVDGRPSIPPERLLRAALLQGFYTVRSERQLMEQLDDNRLFRWFVGLGIDDPVWVPTVFTKNRDRLLEADVAKKFLAALLNHWEARPSIATPRSISMVRSDRTPPTSRPLIHRPSSIAKAGARRPSSLTSAIR